MNLQTPKEEPITCVLIMAIINHMDRNKTYEEIMSELVCTRHTAKKLFYAFIWGADEDSLEKTYMESTVNG